MWSFFSTRRRRSSRRGTACRPRLQTLEDRCTPSTFVVLNTHHTGTGPPPDCINPVNGDASDSVVNPDLIKFNIAGSGIQTIQPQSALPPITKPVVIDGYTQGGQPNNLPDGDNASILIKLSGSQAKANANGLVITGS